MTLIELMIALAVLAIILGLATPSLRDLLQRNRLVSQTNDLVADINLTRTTAVTTGQTMTICARGANNTTCGNDWNNGWLVFYDCNNSGTVQTATNTCPNIDGTSQIPEAVIKVREAAETDTTVTEVTSAGYANTIRFRSNGMLVNSGGSHVMRVCANSVTDGRRISVGPGGRPVLSVWLNSEADPCS